MIGLTAQQSRLLTYLRSYLDSSGGVAPTVREMVAGIGSKSVGSVHSLLARLEERGHIRRIPERARAIEIVDVGPLHSVPTADLIAELERRRAGSVQTNPEVVGA
ncbi:hypothetical protein [Novosphingobium sp. ZW T3_23]|uniref:LexA family protein n=1 Tax=Novosphingobium sp. ZW T3_23 TaxID=3378084 RepID=UPI00385422CF